MADKQAGKDAMAFIVAALKRSKDMAYADVQARAKEAGHTIYPIMFGRAKALLGYVKVAKRGEGKQGKKAKAAAGRAGKSGKAPARRKTAGRARQGKKRGRPARVAGNGSVESVVEALRDGERERAQLLKALEQIRAVLEAVG